MRKAHIISVSATTFLQKRAYESAGLVLLLLGVMLLSILVTYDPYDPSLNTAVSMTPSNLFGLPGALVADFFFQAIGLAAFCLPLACLYFGWRVIRHTHRSQPLAAVNWTFVATFLASCLFSFLPAEGKWSFSHTYGGMMGYIWLTGIPRLIGFKPAIMQGLTLVMGCVLGGVRLWQIYLKNWFANLGKQESRRRASPQAAEAERSEPQLRKTILKRPLPTAAEWEYEETSETNEEIEAPQEVAAKEAPRKRVMTMSKRTMLPPLDLLQTPPKQAVSDVNATALQAQAQQLEAVLEEFGVKGKIVQVRPGPVVTLYELEPSAGTKSSRVIGLADDIARSMCAVSARLAIIPGRNAIGIELPNPTRQVVYLKELLTSQTFENTAALLPLALGKDIGGAPVVADLAKMPHLLLAGTTGSGKSVAVNTMILSLLYRLTPDRCKFIMIDPKMLELSVYDGIPHLLSPVVTDPRKAIVALKWTVREMEERYRAMSSLGVRNIEGYNQRLREARESGVPITRRVQTGFDPESGKPIFENQSLELNDLPYIVVVVDEMADLMLVAGKDIEAAVQRLAQMARAAGIHLVMATQRPSVDVITGTIKANFPSRISFQVTSKIDSRTILGEQGAEQLLGQGDMLYMISAGRIVRLHGPYVTDREVEEIVKSLKDMGEPDYRTEITEDPEESNPQGEGVQRESLDPLFDQAVALICREKKASTSFIQRHFQIGYNRAARLIDQMEAQGIVGPANHVGRRDILARVEGE